MLQNPQKGLTLTLTKGYIKVPEVPGLGVELNEDMTREYAREGEPFFEE